MAAPIIWVWRAALYSASNNRFVRYQGLPARARLLSLVQRRRESDRCLHIDLRRTRYSRDLRSFCCSPRPALAGRVTTKTLVRDALRRAGMASSTTRDHSARSSIDTLSGGPSFPGPLRMAGTLGSMLLRLLSLIDSLATSPPQREGNSGERPTVKPSIQGFDELRRQKFHLFASRVVGSLHGSIFTRLPALLHSCNLVPSFSAQKSHVKPQNYPTHLESSTSAWHFSYAQTAILDIRDQNR